MVDEKTRPRVLNQAECSKHVPLRQFPKRCNSGQAIVEGVVALIMIVGACIGLLLLYLNMCIMAEHHYKMQLAASEAARYIDHCKYWLGEPRPDYKQEVAYSNARIVADAILKQFGLPATSNFSITETPVEGMIGGAVSINRVDLSVKGLRTVGGVFPLVSLTASGAATDQIVPPYATCDLTFENPYNPMESKSVELPAYYCVKHNFGITAGNANLANGTPYANASPNFNTPTQIHATAIGEFNSNAHAPFTIQGPKNEVYNW